MYQDKKKPFKNKAFRPVFKDKIKPAKNQKKDKKKRGLLPLKTRASEKLKNHKINRELFCLFFSSAWQTLKGLRNKKKGK